MNKHALNFYLWTLPSSHCFIQFKWISFILPAQVHTENNGFSSAGSLISSNPHNQILHWRSPWKEFLSVFVWTNLFFFERKFRIAMLKEFINMIFHLINCWGSKWMLRELLVNIYIVIISKMTCFHLVLCSITDKLIALPKRRLNILFYFFCSADFLNSEPNSSKFDHISMFDFIPKFWVILVTKIQAIYWCERNPCLFTWFI